MDKSKAQKTKKTRGGKKNQEKLSIVFDQEARKDFLLGFSKRKKERKELFKVKMENKLQEEKIRIQQKWKMSNPAKLSSSHRILPEVQDLLEEEEAGGLAEVYNFGSKSVTISSLHGIKRTTLQPKSNEEESEDESDEEEAVPENKGKQKMTERKSTNLMLSRTKVFKQCQKLKQTKKFRKGRLPKTMQQPGKTGKKFKQESVKAVKGKQKIKNGKRKMLRD